ncbi:MAG: hypothetical protein Q4D73_05045 [Actinomycetaceae bacterium]|nr:hypothetical protein [Actinomycetaceae bacterium]
MKLSKKLAAATLAFALTISLSACGNGISAADLKPKPVKSLSEAKEKQAEPADKDTAQDKNSTDTSKDSDQKDSQATDGKLNPVLQAMIDEVNAHDITKTPEGKHLLSARAIGEAPGTLIYEYVLKPIPSPTAFASNMDKLAPKDLAPIAEQIKKQMEKSGIENPKIIYRYYLDNGETVVWEHTF